MRAQFIRGQDPKDALKLGNVSQRLMDRGRVLMRKALEEIVQEFGGSFRIYRLPKSNIVRGLWKPGPEIFSWDEGKRFLNYSIDQVISDEYEVYYRLDYYKSGTGEALGGKSAGDTIEEAKKSIIHEFLESDSRA